MKKAQVLIISVMLLAFLVVAPISAQDAAETKAETTIDSFPSALGVNFNYPLLGGLAWQRWFGNFGITVTTGGYYNPEGSQGFGTLYCEPTYLLTENQFTPWFSGRLYLASLIGAKFASYTPGYLNLAAGLGFGTELILFDHFSYSVNALYVVEYPLSVEMTGSTAFKYRFK